MIALPWGKRRGPSTVLEGIAVLLGCVMISGSYADSTSAPTDAANGLPARSDAQSLTVSRPKPPSATSVATQTAPTSGPVTAAPPQGNATIPVEVHKVDPTAAPAFAPAVAPTMAPVSTARSSTSTAGGGSDSAPSDAFGDGGAGVVDRRSSAANGMGPSKQVDDGKVASTPKIPVSRFGADFDNAYRQVEPMTPAQITEFHRRENAIERAKDLQNPPRISTLSLAVNLEAGYSPHTIMLTDGYVTVLSFHDIVGADWPVLSATIGDKEMFSLEMPEKPDNIVMVEPKKDFARTNIVILLKDATVPVTLSLEAAGEASYYNANIDIQQRGPNTSVATPTPLPGAIDDDKMRAILDGSGSVSSGVRRVSITGGPAEAYFVDEKFYLRTRLTVESPMYNSVIHSANMALYELPPTPLILASDDDGKVYELHPTDATLIDGAITSRSPYDPLHPLNRKSGE